MLHATRRHVLVGLAAGLAFGPPALAARRTSEDLSGVLAPGARLQTLYSGGRWCEGLCWAPALGGLVFSDVRRNTMSVLGSDGSVRTLRDPSRNANGNALDAQGRLVTCEHRTRRVVRAEPGGELTMLAERFEDRRLNAPNDVALAPDGSLWFTDPVFGIRQPDEGLMAEPEQRARRVYRITPGGAVEAMISAIDQPNGLAFSADGRTLYVSDAGASLNPEAGRAIHAFALGPDGRPGEGRRFAEPDGGAVPDGLCVDGRGRVFAACTHGVQVWEADGRRLGRIPTAGPAANLALGGADGRRLFIGQGPHIHAIDLAG
ncbi:SMP-30/gluconolactonase/LRE family protein [Aureimonas sp. AU4]|uniref:SMP-30/gluconolactonase/LRE family protein n=1 Tax=Aureimonas sp. AU4 TaxID=1638163 RepID=UPI0007833AFA|nr:SMP-30/gluconolactonase/LRE family protein [Aureimonas sp. AU4]